MRFFYLIIFIFLIGSKKLTAQSIDLGTWSILNLKYNFNDKWSVFGETQIRSLQFYNQFHYYEYKGGLNVKLHKDVLFTVGAGSFQTFKEGGNFVLPRNNDEFRVWPQIVLNQSLGEFKIEQRYRPELRYTSNGFRNRFRYRLGISYPLCKEEDGYTPLQVNVSNELFFTDREPYFERSRAILALNYKSSKSTTIQIGYLYQFDYKINDETGQDFIQIAYFIELFGKKPQQVNKVDLKGDD